MTLDERLKLIREVGARREQIMGKFGPTVTAHTRQQAWLDIADAMNEQGAQRTVKQLKEAWQNLLKKCRRVYSAYKKHEGRTGESEEFTYSEKQTSFQLFALKMVGGGGGQGRYTKNKESLF